MRETAITTTGLTKRYGSLTAVDDVDLRVPTGQIMAFLGPNGAGKSTTNEMILGLVTPDEGTVEVFGESPHEAVRRGDVGAMLQNGALLADTNVRGLLRTLHGIHAHPLPLGEVIERAELGDILKTPTGKLSGGQAQRVRFAMAIMGSPKLIILDEPTVGMDVELRRRFWAQMEDLASHGRTVIFATHYLDEADAYAERIVVISDGRIVADGTGADIKRRVGGRTVTFVGPDLDYEHLPGVVSATRDGERHQLVSADSDETLRHLITRPVHSIEVTSAKLEDAFVAITEGAHA
ncbi:MAG: ABC transporter ATP-binding protein [Propionibacterium sp.]|nr:ABC transporter ATP-binding protein [Propionibacterium sp.]